MKKTNSDNEALCVVNYLGVTPSTSFTANVDPSSSVNGNHFAPNPRNKKRHLNRRTSTILPPNPNSQMIKRYMFHRWRIFAGYTTLHGVKEIYKAPMKKLKILWLVILTLCAAIMLFQICKLTAHFLTEPVTTTVTVKNEFYELPLFLLVAHTRELFMHNKIDVAKNYSGLDADALVYAQSLVDRKVILTDGLVFERARRKFNEYLETHPGETWHSALEPYLHDLSDWIGADDHLRIHRRSMWAIATYHLLTPVGGRSSELDLTHDFIVEVPLHWTDVESPPIAEDGPASLMLTSYGLQTDAIKLEAGHIYKIRFDVTSQRSVNLRRKSCRNDFTQYLMYDQQKCNETCLAKAELQFAPRKCYDHSLFEWGFLELYSTMRPCSYGFFNSSGGPFDTERPEQLEGASVADMRKAYEKCYEDNCLPACEQLSVKFSTTTREFGQDLKNRSLLFATWPAPSAVPVYDEALQYTWDGFVGQLGGLIGLWMGASMMSAFEALYLCCCCCYDVVGEEEYEDEERMYGMGMQKRNDGQVPKIGNDMKNINLEQMDMKNGVYNMDDTAKNDVWLPRAM